MNGLVWLASYPKSGNTWFRMLVANLWGEGGTPADINDLPGPGGFACSRGLFDYLTLIDSGLLTDDEIDCLRPRLYEAMARGEDRAEEEANSEARLVKVHDAYTRTPLGEPLLAGATAAVVIVRDPRAVAPSLANHNDISLDQAIAEMANPAACYCASCHSQPRQLRQKLLNWSAHVESWLDQRDIPVHLLRYEDLKADPAVRFQAAMRFTGSDVTRERAERAARLADFSNLREQEQARGFRESARGRVFFRKGQVDSWKEELTSAQVARIEADHGRVMARLGYL